MMAVKSNEKLARLLLVAGLESASPAHYLDPPLSAMFLKDFLNGSGC